MCRTCQDNQELIYVANSNFYYVQDPNRNSEGDNYPSYNLPDYDLTKQVVFPHKFIIIQTTADSNYAAGLALLESAADKVYIGQFDATRTLKLKI